MTPQPKAEQEKRPLRASVVVVSHDRRELLEKCLASLEKSEGREDLQLIVVDNGSRDGAAELEDQFPRAQWVRLPKNFGLTKAMNLGWRAADSELVLFLHDDTELPPEAVLRMAETLEQNPNVAAVCPLLVDANGNPAPQLGKLPPDGHWRPAECAPGDPPAVEYPRGAALMTRVALIKAVRQIDERFGQFGADADLAANFKRASKKVLLLPGIQVRHHGSRGYTPEERADFLLARAAYLGKYQGFGAGLTARMASIFAPLFGFRFAEFKNTISGQKIDGTGV